MFIPFKVPSFHEKVLSIYKAAVQCSAGSLVDIDTSDTTAITASVGFTALTAGSIKLATINSTSAFPRELGMSIPTVNLTGPTLEEKILELASSYMTIPVGTAAAIYTPTPGDIVATDQFVGNLAGDTGATGIINPATAGNLGAACEVFQGRFRLIQTGNPVRARFLGNTTGNGVAVALFQFA